MDAIAMLVEIKATHLAVEWRLKAKAQTGSQKKAVFHDAISVLTVCTSMIETWQVLGVVAASLTLSDIWFNIFGSTALASNFEFFKPTASSFAIIFYVLSALSVAAVAWFIAMLLLSETASQKKLVQYIKSFVEETREHASRDEIATRKRGPKDTISQVALHMIAFLYMPVTQLAIKAIFCRRSVMCLYDCYHDATHNSLVVVGIAVLVLVTAVVPLVFAVVILRAKAEYRGFLGQDVLSQQSEELYWITFTDAMGSPFARVYRQYQPQRLYFGIWMFFYKTLMSVLLVIQ